MLFNFIKKSGETSSGSHEKKKNKRMFWQSFVQDLFNANDLVWQCFLSGLVTNSRMWVFFADTLVWELSPICDGLVNLLFDGKLRRPFWSKRKNGCQTTEQPTRSIFKTATSRNH
ncbi:unnamed protein product [Cylicocyclus nassatus]|uniref:7TM GPCR serpentine receptor class x (Srx) domain-containing protein n=1 Tax=Cylicocyclus nassatus TaxID=53992 RepID=A0AA36M878_CYLNA|nr:unnamed protein product [Cylicocyclus nassatus]